MVFIIYDDIESLIKELYNCINNPEKFSTAKIGKRIPCGYPISAIWAFDHIKIRIA